MNISVKDILKSFLSLLQKHLFIIICSIVSAVVGGIIVDYYKDVKSQSIEDNTIENAINQAQELRCANLPMDALRIHSEILENKSIQRKPLYIAMLANNQGLCWRQLAGKENDPSKLILSINNHKKALDALRTKKSSTQYALTQSLMGGAYMHLSLFQDEEQNILKAIDAFNEAVRAYTIQKQLVELAEAKKDLGNAYRALSTIRDKETNLVKSISIFEDCLQIYTPYNYPLNYAEVQNHTGFAYEALASIRNEEENLNKAIYALIEALKIAKATSDKIIFDQSLTRGMLGLTYYQLSFLHNRKENLKRALPLLDEFAKNRRNDANEPNFRHAYGCCKACLGDIYHKLAVLMNEPNNLKMAIANYEEASTMVNSQANPYLYASFQTGLGEVYFDQYMVKRSPSLLEKSILTLENALIAYDCNEHFSEYSESIRNLSGKCGMLFLLTGKKENELIKLIEDLKNILNKTDIKKEPYTFALTQMAIGRAYCCFYGRKDKKQILMKAIPHLEQSLEILTINENTFDYGITQLMLGNSYALLSEVSDKQNNLSKAIQAYEKSLVAFSAEEFGYMRDDIIKAQKICKKRMKSWF